MPDMPAERVLIVDDEASARTVADSQLSASITSGSNAHAAYVASNNTRAGVIESAASAEVAARIAGDSTLQSNLNT